MQCEAAAVANHCGAAPRRHRCTTATHTAVNGTNCVGCRGNGPPELWLLLQLSELFVCMMCISIMIYALLNFLYTKMIAYYDIVIHHIFSG